MKYCRVVVFMLVSVALPLESGAQSPRLDAAFQAIYEASPLVGFTVGVIRDDSIAYQGSFGFADYQTQTPYTNRTWQPIGSLSKQVLGLACLKAIELEYFTLETPINDVLPFAVVNPHSPDTPIRVKHLLSHTSGIQDTDAYYAASYVLDSDTDVSTPGATYMMNTFGAQLGKPTPLRHFLHAYLVEGEEDYSTTNFLNAAAGTTYAYSNIGSTLAGYLLEMSTGQTLEAFTQEYIFDPLGMTETRWNGTGLDAAHQATLHLNRDTPLPPYTLSSYPDGGLNTTNHDFARFVLEVMRGVQGRSSLFEAKTFMRLTDNALGVVPAEQPPHKTISFFWYWDDRGRNTLYGSDPGHLTMLLLDVKRGSGYFVLQNIDYDDAENAEALGQSFGEITALAKQVEQGTWTDK